MRILTWPRIALVVAISLAVGCAERAASTQRDPRPAAAPNVSEAPGPPRAEAPNDAPRPAAPVVTVSPFELKLGRKARWVPGREGFDPQLPGYHLVGDIASVTLAPADRSSWPAGAEPAAELVFRLQTSPGMAPNVENLTVTGSGISLATQLSKGDDGKGMIEVREGAEGPAAAPKLVPQSQYLQLKVRDGAVELRLLEKTMKLLEKGGTISWIDWYRG